ncbi:MAG TPA: helix-turn-helix transcriptional regulator [Flavobacterium sp.]|nr:helix-turn-helix transcriptional regulator [Flavobacterium sp.]
MGKVNEKEASSCVVDLGKKIKSIIVERQLRVMDVAHDANLDPNNLRKYLRGTQEMRIGTLFRIAKALDISPSELIEGLK